MNIILTDVCILLGFVSICSCLVTSILVSKCYITCGLHFKHSSADAADSIILFY